MFIFIATAIALFFGLTFAAWRRYLWVAETAPCGQTDTSQYSLSDVFDDRQFLNVKHQKGIRWLTEVFSRSSAIRKYPPASSSRSDGSGRSAPLTSSAGLPSSAAVGKVISLSTKDDGKSVVSRSHCVPVGALHRSGHDRAAANRSIAGAFQFVGCPG
jgi:hypothetical protein